MFKEVKEVKGGDEIQRNISARRMAALGRRLFKQVEEVKEVGNFFEEFYLGLVVERGRNVYICLKKPKKSKKLATSLVASLNELVTTDESADTGSVRRGETNCAQLFKGAKEVKESAFSS